MKKLLTFFLVLSMLSLSLCACMDTSGTDNQGNGSASQGGASSNLGDYNIVIESCRLATDYSGAPIVIVKYKFTNNDDDSASFAWSVSAEVYQDGIGLNECFLADDSANYSTDNQYKEIKKGATLSVEVAYKLNDTTTDIEVEVSELISFSNKKVTKTFSIE